MNDKARICKTAEKVIRDTIAHWERMIAWTEKRDYREIADPCQMFLEINEAPGSDHCPLCRAFIGLRCIGAHGFLIHQCSQCPLFARFGSCIDSPRNHYGRLSAQRYWRDWLVVARAFLEQIKSLLPAEQKQIDWTKPVRTVKKPHLVPRLVDQFTVYAIQTKEDLGNGCKARYFEYVDQYGRELFFAASGPQIIENVPEEPEYIPLKRGDRLTVDNNEYLLVQVGSWWSLIDMAHGFSWKATETDDACCDDLSLREFKTLLQGKADQWREIYKTVRRHGN